MLTAESVARHICPAPAYGSGKRRGTFEVIKRYGDQRAAEALRRGEAEIARLMKELQDQLDEFNNGPPRASRLEYRKTSKVVAERRTGLSRAREAIRQLADQEGK